MVESDELLVREIKKGNTALYDKLVHKYQNKIFQLVTRTVRSSEDAKDITQETLIQAYKQIFQFNQASSFYTWLYRIAVNKTLDFLRKEKSLVQKTEKVVETKRQSFLLEEMSNSPEEVYILKEKQLHLQKIIYGLPEIYRVTIVMHHFQQLSYEEIAEILDIPVKTVGTRIYRARLILKESLLKGGKEDEVSRNKEKSTGLSKRRAQ